VSSLVDGVRILRDTGTQIVTFDVTVNEVYFTEFFWHSNPDCSGQRYIENFVTSGSLFPFVSLGRNPLTDAPEAFIAAGPSLAFTAFSYETNERNCEGGQVLANAYCCRQLPGQDLDDAHTAVPFSLPEFVPPFRVR